MLAFSPSVHEVCLFYALSVEATQCTNPIAGLCILNTPSDFLQEEDDGQLSCSSKQIFPLCHIDRGTP